MSVDKFGRTFLREIRTETAAAAAQPEGVGRNYLPLTGGRLAGNLDMSSHNIGFTTGHIAGQEQLNFQVNREARLVIRDAGLDACNKKIANVATPTEGTDSANKAYVDSAVQRAGDTGSLQLVLASCTDSANQAIEAKDASEGHANNARSQAQSAEDSARAAAASATAAASQPDAALRDKTYVQIYRNDVKSWENVNSWFNQLTHIDLAAGNKKYWFVYNTGTNEFEWVEYQFHKVAVNLQRQDIQSYVDIRLTTLPNNGLTDYEVYTEMLDGSVEKMSSQQWAKLWVKNTVLYLKLVNPPSAFVGKIIINYIKCHNI